MKRIIILLSFLLTSLASQAQGVRVNCCGTRPQDTAVIGRNAIISGYVDLPMYAGTDTTKFLWVDASGNMVLRKAPAGGGGGGAVSSVNGYIGDVVLTTSDISEGRNKYFTDARVYADTTTFLNYTKALTNYGNAYGLNFLNTFNTRNIKVDTSLIASLNKLYKIRDSILGIGYLTAAVTSITAGYGLAGGTINSSGTITADTTKIIPFTDTAIDIATKAWANNKFLSSFTETDPVATGKTETVSNGWGMKGGGSAQTIGSNPVWTLYPDSFYVASRARLYKVRDSIIAIGYITTAVTSITAGTGLSGGTITSTGTISMPNVGTAGTYGDASHIPSVTTDAQGRITGVTTYTVNAGGGTVTTVSVVTANGVSGSVANATTTPAITLTLGAITPSSVVASGSVSGSNLSGTNTGDQTITLTGDVTGSGTGSFATTISANAVTNSKIANSTIDLTAKVTGALPIANGGTNATSFSTGSVPYFDGTRLTQNNSNFYFASGLLSVGTAGDFTGTNAINIYGQYDAYQPNSAVGTVSGLTIPGITASTSRGTGTSPVINNTGDLIGNHSFWAYTGASPAYTNMAGVVGSAVGATSTNLGGQLDFYTKQNNSSSYVSGFTVKNDQHLIMEGVTSTGATGTGNIVFGTSPTLVTPVLGTPASGNLANCTFPTLNQNTSGNAATVTTNANLTGPITSVGNATSIAAQTGTGTTFVVQSSPTVTGTPAAPTASTGTNTTQIATTAFTQAAITATSVNTVPLTAGTNNTITVPISTGVTGLGTGIATWLATPTSANLATAVATTSTGSGSLVFSASPALTGSPTVPTQSANDNSTKVASTAYVDAGMAAVGVQTITAASYSVSCTPTTTVTATAATVFFDITAQAGAILFNAPTGTWANHQHLQITLKDNNTARAITYNPIYRSGTTITAPTTTTLGKELRLLYDYDANATKFDLIGYVDGY